MPWFRMEVKKEKNIICHSESGLQKDPEDNRKVDTLLASPAVANLTLTTTLWGRGDYSYYSDEDLSSLISWRSCRRWGGKATIQTQDSMTPKPSYFHLRERD